MISITGSSGKTGRAIVRALVARGAPVRAVVGRPGHVSGLSPLGATEVAIGDLTRKDAVVRSLAGSTVVYHICPNMRRDEEEIGQRVIDVCRQLDIERFVYHSVLHPQIEAMPHHWKKLRVEERLIESGLKFTILQPAAYMQNVRGQWDSMTTRGVYEVPYAATTRLGMVDLHDVAEAAATVLTGDRHDAATYELCGPEVLDQRQVAAVVAGRLGCEVRVDVLDREVWARRARDSGLSDYSIKSLGAMFGHYERHGMWGSPRVLEGLLGRPPATFEQVVNRWVAEWET